MSENCSQRSADHVEIPMEKARKNSQMLREHDFAQGVRGKYARRYARGSNVVVLEPDVAKVFPNAEAVNTSLRGLAQHEHLHANHQHIRTAIHQRSTDVMPKQKSTGKRTTIKPKGDSKGRIKESDDVGRSLKKDREKKAKKIVRSGYGDRGDQKRR